jgi:hypothetical protein
MISGKSNHSRVRLLPVCVLACVLGMLISGMACDRDSAVNDPGDKGDDVSMKTASEQETAPTVKQVKDDGIDWRKVMATAPEDWSDGLKAQIAAAGYDLDEIVKKQAAVAKGKMTKKVDWEAVSKKIEAEVASGAMTREQADAKYRAIREKMSRKAGDDTAERKEASDIEDIGLRIRMAIERGDLTPEEGRKKMEAIHRSKHKGDGDRPRKLDRDDGVDWDTAKSTAPEDWSDELKAQMVAAGYDPDQIAERIRMGRQGEEGKTTEKVDLKAVKQKLETAVKAGTITREEADARLKAYILRLKGAMIDKK